MKVKGLDGKIHNLNLTGHVPLNSDDRPRSKFHLAARALLKEIFPYDLLLEEVLLPGSGGLFLDFYIPSRNIAFEVHGQQHYKHVDFFHDSITGYDGTKNVEFNTGYWASKRRDMDKRTWCEINKITLIELPFNEDLNGWRRRINDR